MPMVASICMILPIATTHRHCAQSVLQIGATDSKSDPHDPSPPFPYWPWGQACDVRAWFRSRASRQTAFRDPVSSVQKEGWAFSCQSTGTGCPARPSPPPPWLEAKPLVPTAHFYCRWPPRFGTRHAQCCAPRCTVMAKSLYYFVIIKVDV